ncbi:MAG: methyl-accepting chemotaxis protein, partial [Pseudomonadota bacterium]
MNETATQDALKEIFDELAAQDDLDGADIFDQMDQIDLDDPDELAALEGLVEGDAFTGFDEDTFFADDAGEVVDIEDVGSNWAAGFFGLVALAAFIGWLFIQYQSTETEKQIVSQTADTTLAQANIKEIGLEALLALNGNEESFSNISNLRADTERLVSRLRNGDPDAGVAAVSPAAQDSLDLVTAQWSELVPQIDTVLQNRSVIQDTLSEVATVNQLSPQLLLKSDELVQKLIDQGASLELINIASRQRFLTQRIKASMNEFAIGAPGWEVAATQFGRDVKQFGQVNSAIASMGGESVQENVREVEALHSTLMQSSDGVMNSVGDYFSMRAAANTVTGLSSSMSELVDNLRAVINRDDRTEVLKNLPTILPVLALLGLIGLIWSILHHARRKDRVNEVRTKVAEDAVIKLLDEMGDLAQGDLRVEAEVTNEVTGAIADSINFAVGEMRVLVNGIQTASNGMTEATDGTEQLIADLLTSNGVQSEEIAQASNEVVDMNAAINRMSSSASNSAERARETAEVAKQGADAVRNTIRGMDTTRTQIQETAKRLKRLGESSQQINEIVDLIQDVTEQTNVLSINASIQAAMAGEAGRGFAVVAEEVQRLADRSARASNEITELVKNIQQDTNNAITSMELTTEEVVS